MDTQRKDNYRNVKSVFCDISSFASRLSHSSSTACTTAPVVLLLPVLSKRQHSPPFLFIKGNAHLISTWTSPLFISLYLSLQAGSLYLSFWVSSQWREELRNGIYPPSKAKPSRTPDLSFLALSMLIKFCFFPKRWPLQLTIRGEPLTTDKGAHICLCNGSCYARGIVT